MFLYVRNIKSLEQAEYAIKKGAVAIAVALSSSRNMEAENTRTWLETLPMHIMKIGEFDNDSYYDVEEMTTFCHLDTILLRDLKSLSDFSRHTGRVMVEITEWELQDLKRFFKEQYELLMDTADGIRLRIADYTNLDNENFWQYIRELNKPVFITCDLEDSAIEDAVRLFESKNVPNLAALFVNFEDLN